MPCDLVWSPCSKLKGCKGPASNLSSLHRSCSRLEATPHSKSNHFPTSLYADLKGMAHKSCDYRVVAQLWHHAIRLGPGLEASMANLQYAAAGDSGTICCQVTVLAFKGEFFNTLLP